METDGGISIGDKVAYIRYFMPFGAYTCYVLMDKQNLFKPNTFLN